MGKAKVKISVKPAKKGSGTLLARVPVAVEKNNNPTGKKMFQTRAQLTIRPQTTRGGKPRKTRRH